MGQSPSTEMTPQRYQRIKDVFLSVCDRPENEQDAHVAALCENDPGMESEIRSLLESHRRVQHTNPTINIPPSESQTVPDPKEEAPAAAPSTPSAEPPPAPPRTHHTRTGSGGRFESGRILCERYRIVSLLGSGGMGEVYRADDMKLDQAVALKFLPKSYSSDPSWLDRLHNEVRLSRQVSHANVCRVFDLDEVEGEQFISMEFVDGEDLASLLRRIGRLPRDKALQIARQICAGLSAAHERGVLHRDLKPANIMLDGRGQVRITDFGISARLDSRPDSAAGTPAYMAPEQFTRGEASVKSDIYSLGLLLYEIFTGRQAFTASSMPEYARMHRQTAPTHPSTFVNDMDPLTERVILRCLEKEPARRPPNVLAVAAALPGGDPLAAALAAGETPSPEMVAAAGGDRGMTIARGSIFVALALVGLALCALLSQHGMLLSRLPLTKPPEVLSEKSRQILTDLGYDKTPQSKAQGFWLDPQYSQWLQEPQNSTKRWDRQAWQQSDAVQFWYRESPNYLVSHDEIGMVLLDDPPRNEPGMRTVLTDGNGHLRRLEIMPSGNTGVAAEQPSDFSKLFEESGIPVASFTPIQAGFTPPMFADHRAAWTGRLPDDPQTVEIDAASTAGMPVFFQIVHPWKVQAEKQGIEPPSDMPTSNIVIQFLLLCVAIASALVLAWRNVRAGRGDSLGAQKLSFAFLILGVAIWMMMASHILQPVLELRLFFRVLGFILVPATVVWTFYLALEPHVRRLWPETIISWNRVLGGRINDRLVAAHVLIGITVAVAAVLLGELGYVIPRMFGHPAGVPPLNFPIRLLGKENPFAVAVFALLMAMYVGLLYLLSLVLFQLILRRRHLASAAFVLLIPINALQWNDSNWIQWAQAAVLTGLVLLLLVRYGLVATIAALWTIYIMRYVPITSDLSSWYIPQTRFVLVLLAITAILTATIATRGWRQPISIAIERAAGATGQNS